MSRLTDADREWVEAQLASAPPITDAGRRRMGEALRAAATAASECRRDSRPMPDDRPRGTPPRTPQRPLQGVVA